MKHITIVVAAALALIGCQQSTSQRFANMCDEQEANDPAAWASSAGACRNAEHLTDDQKKIMLHAYAELKRARGAVGQ